MSTVFTILICWIAVNVLILIVGFFYERAERHVGHDPLDSIFNEERVHRATVTQLYPHHGRHVTGTPIKAPAPLDTARRTTRKATPDDRTE